jgi:hypothetical protein
MTRVTEVKTRARVLRLASQVGNGIGLERGVDHHCHDLLKHANGFKRDSATVSTGTRGREQAPQTVN